MAGEKQHGLVKRYPDMTRLFAAKEARRRMLANLPIVEKMEVAERLREMAEHAPGRNSKGSAGNVR